MKVSEYIAALPPDRAPVFKKIRTAIRKGLPKGFKEVMQYNMPSWVVPHRLYPPGYHVSPDLPLPFISLGNQKGHIGFYHMGLYSDPKLMTWFRSEWQSHCDVKLDMGKSCVRLKKLNAVPFELLEQLCSKVTPTQWIRTDETQRLR